MDRERRSAGLRVRREVLGDAHVDRAAAEADQLTGDFQEMVVDHAWAGVWARPGLDRRTRSCITMAMLVAALGCEHELEMHVRGASRCGVSRDEIREVLLQVAIYAGFPRANRAFAIAREVLAEAGGPLEEEGAARPGQRDGDGPAAESAAPPGKGPQQ